MPGTPKTGQSKRLRIAKESHEPEYQFFFFETGRIIKVFTADGKVEVIANPS